MNRLLIQTLSVIFISLTVLSCATIFGKSKYPVTLNSTPSSAMFLVTNKKGDTILNGRTPSVIKLKSSKGYFQKAKYDITFSTPGYADKTYPIRFSINGFYFGNLLIGGLLGMLVIDPLSGRMWALPSGLRTINAVLTPNNSLPTGSLEIIDLKDISDETRKKLILIK